MSIIELGALGEFVGSIAVVVTLAYLAVQVRLNSISTRSATNAAVAGQFVELNLVMASNPELAKAMAVDLRHPETSSLENIVQLLAFWRSLFHTWSNAHRQHLNNTLDPALYEAIVQEVSMYAEGSHDGGSTEELAGRGRSMRWAWESERYIFNQDFQSFVDKNLGVEVRHKIRSK